ncbi:MAG: hypothetical protein AAFZ58_16360 [Pseudomonadota bacterium]
MSQILHLSIDAMSGDRGPAVVVDAVRRGFAGALIPGIAASGNHQHGG